jgi:branched-chain amino acid transport system ATP-binding protein
MLEIKNVSTSYGHVEALREVSMAAKEGEIVSLIGANGAGKTTLLNTISGMTPARSGQILLNGADITRLSPEKIVNLGVCQVPERRQVFTTLSVRDNLTLGAYTRMRGRGEPPIKDRKTLALDIGTIYAMFPILKQREKQLAGTLSGGEQQMLAIGRSLMGRPKVLLLDEPSLGLAPLIVRDIFEIINCLREIDTIILLVEQNARAALRVADRAYVLETGRIVMSGPAADLAADPAIQQAYLGRMGK